MPLDPAQDQDFLKAPRDQQIQYLRSFDPDFAKASPGDQSAYLDHVTKTAKTSSSAARVGGDATSADIIKQMGGGPHPTTSSIAGPIDRFNQRVASDVRPVGHPMEFLRGVSQQVQDYRAQHQPEGSLPEQMWGGLKVLGGGVADLAKDYYQNPSHLFGDVATAMIPVVGDAEIPSRPVMRGVTNGIEWGTGGKGPLALRGKMIPSEPMSGTFSRTIPVKPVGTAPTLEAPLPGVNVPPNVGRLYEPTSALQRASEPPAPANPSAVQLKPSIGRISEFNAKPVEAAITPETRAATPTVPAGAKPVEVETPRRAGARLIDYKLGRYADKFDRTSPAHQDIVDLGHPELASEANRIGFKGRTDWKGSDFSRSGYGKYSHPDAMELRSELIDEADRPAGTPSRMRGVQSKLPSPEQEARIKKSMVSRDAAKRDLEKPKEPVWPSQYSSSPRSLSSSGGGGANYSADDLAKIKAKYGIK
jgi:hypothetical protein